MYVVENYKGLLLHFPEISRTLVHKCLKQDLHFYSSFFTASLRTRRSPNETRQPLRHVAKRTRFTNALPNFGVCSPHKLPIFDFYRTTKPLDRQRVQRQNGDEIISCNVANPAKKFSSSRKLQQSC